MWKSTLAKEKRRIRESWAVLENIFIVRGRNDFVIFQTKWWCWTFSARKSLCLFKILYILSSACILKECIQEVLFEISEWNEQFNLEFGNEKSLLKGRKTIFCLQWPFFHNDTRHLHLGLVLGCVYWLYWTIYGWSWVRLRAAVLPFTQL